MQGQGFIDQNNCLVFPDEVGAFVGDRKPVQKIARSPVTGPTRTYRQPLRRIGSSPAGVLDSVKTWWASLSKEWRWGILGGIGLLGVMTAALGKKEGKGTWLKKV